MPRGFVSSRPMADSPRCVFCGTPRPAEVPRCPECGNRWIDATIAEAVAPPSRPPTPVAPTVHEVDVAARDKRRKRRRWVFPLSITLAAVAIYAIVFVVLIERSGPDDEPDAGVTTTTAVSEPTSTTSGPDQSTTTTAATTTTSTEPPSSTTTTEPPPSTTTLPPIEPDGRPIAIEDLTLGAFALGPLTIGDDEVDALGRLVATLGQPDSIRDIGEADGLCPTETGREARFGWLTVLVRTEGDTEVLAAYRVEEPGDGASDDPTAGLETISGAKIGDTVDQWNSIYRTSEIRIDEVDGRPVLLLLRSSDQRTLLWGPVDDGDPQRVIGIYSPRPCDGGPFPT